MIFRPSREQRGPDRWLNAKVAIFCLGAGTALVGIAIETTWVVNVAIGILAVGFLMRFLPRKQQPLPPDNGSDESAHTE